MTNSKNVDKYSALDMISDFRRNIQRFKENNPGADVEEILSQNEDLLPMLEYLRNSELSNFVSYAKGQGTKMSFSDMEMGVFDAGRKDMQKGLGEIVDSLKFEKPECPECGEKEDNRGRSKKN